MSELQSVSAEVQVPAAASPGDFDDYVVPEIPVPGVGTIFADNFESYATEITAENSDWTYIGSAISLDVNGGVNNSKCIKVAYNGQGNAPYVASKNIQAENASEFWVQFDIKQIGEPGGSKVFKMFGTSGETDSDPNTAGYAHVTFAEEYSNNKFVAVSYGDGSTSVNNDTQKTIRYNGVADDPLVNVIVSDAPFYTKTFHKTFKAYWKYSTDGNRDGEVKVWWDGVLMLHADNIKNRHDSNPRTFKEFNLAGYTAASAGVFDQYFDNFSLAHTEEDLI